MMMSLIRSTILTMGSVDPNADVAGLEPPVLGEGGRGLVGKIPVALEDAGVLGLDLAGLLVDSQLGSRVGNADRAELHAPDRVESGDGRVLGHAVELVDRDPQAHEELEDLRGDRRCARRRPATPPQTDPLEQRAKDQWIPERRRATGSGRCDCRRWRLSSVR